MRFAARLEAPDDIEGWRALARRACAAGVPPDRIDWRVGDAETSLFAGDGDLAALRPVREPSASRAFVGTCERTLLHADPRRFDLAYSLLHRLQEERGLMAVASDPQVIAFAAFARAVRRDMHKMTAFVRFREVAAEDGAPAFIAWFEPEHHILRAVAPFFVDRFAGMRWSILTPKGSAHWNGEALRLGPAADRASAPTGDRLEELWRGYYGAIFNPARLMPKAMRQHMPKKYWKNLPEAELIGGLIATARTREIAMIAREANNRAKRRRPEAEPDPADLEACRRCPLYAAATQPVAGEGPRDAAIMIVGEQPGDQEDLSGRPFVGPAGKMLDAALREAGLDRERLFLTNAVKHFKFTPRGKRRIHQKPSAGEIAACNLWLDRELDDVRPKLIVALGATAAYALTGNGTGISSRRGAIIGERGGAPVLASIHPSFILRQIDPADRETQRGHLVADLRRAAEHVKRAASAS